MLKIITATFLPYLLLAALRMGSLPMKLISADFIPKPREVGVFGNVLIRIWAMSSRNEPALCHIYDGEDSEDCQAPISADCYLGRPHRRIGLGLCGPKQNLLMDPSQSEEKPRLPTLARPQTRWSWGICNFFY